jgi:3-oxoacyl-[acyl-carrier-protein] synthase I
MPAPPILIEHTGLITSVGMSAPASCAAMRAKVSNPSETRFRGADGAWVMAHQVELTPPVRGLHKLARMASLAIEESLQALPRADWAKLPLLLCVAEAARPGRVAGLDEQLFPMIERELGVSFAAHSMVITQGRVGAAVALAQARTLITQGRCERVLVAAVDSLLHAPTLDHYAAQGRLLSPVSSNGFMPGEGAGAMLVGRPLGQTAQPGELWCMGCGFGVEAAHIDSGEPLRAEGLRQALVGALTESGRAIHEMDYRIADLSGEHYYFKEATLARSRLMRVLKDEFDIWHPAESIGETGALAGVAIVALAQAAGRKGYALGRQALVHLSNDAGQRAALVLQHGGPHGQ